MTSPCGSYALLYTTVTDAIILGTRRRGHIISVIIFPHYPVISFCLSLKHRSQVNLTSQNLYAVKTILWRHVTSGCPANIRPEARVGTFAVCEDITRQTSPQKLICRDDIMASWYDTPVLIWSCLPVRTNQVRCCTQACSVVFSVGECIEYRVLRATWYAPRLDTWLGLEASLIGDLHLAALSWDTYRSAYPWPWHWVIGIVKLSFWCFNWNGMSY
jgi:hypothetical protein